MRARAPFNLVLATAVWCASSVRALDPSATEALDAFLSQHPIATRSAPSSQSSETAVQRNGLLQGNWTGSLTNMTAGVCPWPCSSTGLDSVAWPVFHSVSRLAACNETMLLDLAVFNNLSDPHTHVSIAACVADLAISDSLPRRTSSAALCLPGTETNNTRAVTAPLQLFPSGSPLGDKSSPQTDALRQLQALALQQARCNETIDFAMSGETAVAVYLGPGLAGQSILSDVLEEVAIRSADIGLGDGLSVQLCDPNTRSSQYTLGISVQTQGNLAGAQAAVQSWKNGNCLVDGDSWRNITFQVPRLTARNSEASFASLDDPPPQPDADDNCYVYLVQSQDTCSSIAAEYSLTVDEINSYNNDTWGWMGCDDLLANMNICLSSGWPPMPTIITNAVCGPQMNDTPIAPHGTNLSTLNSCPLNACCDIWGQCGTTSEFCTISQSETGAPGTAAQGQNGCISNCGTDIVVSGVPSEIYKVGYFEGFDWTRPCVRPSISQLDTTSYTHIHYSFATISADYTLNLTSIQAQFPFFTALTGVKRILSVGGWDFSTDPSTYNIFREAVQSENRATLIQSVLDTLDKYDLDGIDWDWEYPAEPDIPGIPVGSESESTNYYLLLAELQAELEGTGRTSSITGPASYWYLKQFPIDAISDVVDYLVLMTYDLHGQWDYGNAFADPGCPAGNCLRSHVNLTETINSLSMVTKAGVPNTKVVVGVASYGRSFKMAEAGCWTEECPYTGPASGALAGQCTETQGYISNAELGAIIATNPTAQEHWDSDSFSNILVYNETEWAAYMNNTNKASRTLLYEVFGFRGTADWAVDLQADPGQTGSSSSSADSIAYIGPTVWSAATPVVTALPGQTLVWPPLQLESATTISFDPWTTVLTYSTPTSTVVTGETALGYDVLTIPTVITIPPVTTTEVAVWWVILPPETTDSIIYVTSSIQPPPITVTVTPVWNGTTTVMGQTVTTQSETVVSFSSQTYILPPTTVTVGSSTVISGGTTDTPVPITITPNPHPTTADTTKDTRLNSRTTSWRSGSPPSPSCAPSQKCGSLPGDWPDPSCPFCPPGIFGNVPGGGGSDNPGDDDDDSSSTTTTTTTTTTTVSYTAAGFHIDNDDTFPTLNNAAAVATLASMSNEIASTLSSLFGTASNTASTTKSTATSTTKTTSTSTSSSAPTASPGDKDVMFALMELYTGISWLFEWQLLDITVGTSFDPCTINPDISVTADTVAPDPDFPDKDIGPFEAHGVSGCQYTAGKDNTVGTMTCPGVDKITCSGDGGTASTSCDGGAVVVLVFDCWWS